MDRDQILSSVKVERLDLADFAEPFTEQEWRTPSLCTGWTVKDVLDLLVHGQDIARPLGHAKPMSPDRVLPALTFVWESPFYSVSKRLDGVRVSATDAQWTRGEGTREIHGPAGELPLLAAGRAVALKGLTGSGVPRARAMLQD